MFMLDLIYVHTAVEVLLLLQGFLSLWGWKNKTETDTTGRKLEVYR
jgi:hypothetical protein